MVSACHDARSSDIGVLFSTVARKMPTASVRSPNRIIAHTHTAAPPIPQKAQDVCGWAPRGTRTTSKTTQVDRIYGAPFHRDLGDAQLHSVPGTPTLDPLASPGVVNKDSAHNGRADGHEMRLALPVNALLVHQLQEGFVDQGRWLKRMARPFAAQVSLCLLFKVVVNQRQELLRDLFPAEGLGLGEEMRNRRGLAAHRVLP